MISFCIDGGEREAIKFMQSLEIFTLAESLGGVESLVECPALMTHASIPESIRETLGISKSLIRLSIGLEDAEDLIQDISHALNAI
jgi:cystathionine gamma-lyase